MSAERTHIPGQLSVEELEKLAHVFASYNGGGYGSGYGGGGYGESDVTEDAPEEEGAGEDSEEEEGA